MTRPRGRRWAGARRRLLPALLAAACSAGAVAVPGGPPVAAAPGGPGSVGSVGSAVAAGVPAARVAAAAPAAPSNISGRGSSYVGPAMTQWTADAYTRGLNVNYLPTNSPDGLGQYQQSTVAFAGTEAEFSSLLGLGNDSQVRRGFQYVPDVAGAVAIMYNVTDQAGNEVDYLRLSRRTVALIFLGEITRWSDRRITNDLGGQVVLPDEPITVVYRSGPSGTTALFYDFVQHMAPAEFDAWVARNRYPTGVRIIDPGVSPGFVPRGLGLGGSDLMAQHVARTPWTITYDEFAYAKRYDVETAWIQNERGEWVQPFAGNISAALESAQLRPDLSQELSGVYRSDRPGAYPISAYSYLVTQCAPASDRPTCKGNYADTGTAETLDAWLRYIACDGQVQMAEIGYSPLPPHLSQEMINSVQRMWGRPIGQATQLTRSNCANPRFDPGYSPPAPPPPPALPDPPGDGGGGDGGDDAGGGADGAGGDDGSGPAGPSTTSPECATTDTAAAADPEADDDAAAAGSTTTETDSTTTPEGDTENGDEAESNAENNGDAEGEDEGDGGAQNDGDGEGEGDEGAQNDADDGGDGDTDADADAENNGDGEGGGGGSATTTSVACPGLEALGRGGVDAVGGGSGTWRDSDPVAQRRGSFDATSPWPLATILFLLALPLVIGAVRARRRRYLDPDQPDRVRDLVDNLKPPPEIVVSDELVPIAPAELAADGLSRRPGARGVRWAYDDGTTRTICRSCVDADPGRFGRLGTHQPGGLLFAEADGERCTSCRLLLPPPADAVELTTGDTPAPAP